MIGRVPPSGRKIEMEIRSRNSLTGRYGSSQGLRNHESPCGDRHAEFIEDAVDARGFGTISARIPIRAVAYGGQLFHLSKEPDELTAGFSQSVGRRRWRRLLDGPVDESVTAEFLEPTGQHRCGHSVDLAFHFVEPVTPRIQQPEDVKGPLRSEDLTEGMPGRLPLGLTHGALYEPGYEMAVGVTASHA